jgi:serine protease Do
MIARRLLAATLALLMLPTMAFAQTQERPDSFADLAAKLLPAVVNISAMSTISGNKNMPDMEIPQFPPGSPFEDFFRDFMDQQRGGGNRPRQTSSLGSGFIIDAKEGYIITNNHVIADSDTVTVILQDDTNLVAKVVGKDEKTDIALLKVDPKLYNLTAVSWGDSDAMRVGDWILAIGNPFGLGGTVTQGIISARARDINSGPYDDFLQTDASINRGNSGGPMFNLKGEVVGINSAIFSPSGGSIGIGFAIPSSLAKTVITQLTEFGRTKRGWLGVRIQAVTPEIAESLNFGTARGALISSISEDGPAAKAGLEPGDIVLMFDGKPIEEMRRLPRIVAETTVNKEVAISLWRNGETIEKKIVVGELEEAEDKGLVESSVGRGTAPDMPKESEQLLGMNLSTLNKQLRMQFEVDDKTEGVLVVGINGESKAAERDVREGDVIVEANQKPIKTPAEFKAQVETAKKEGRKSVFLLLERKGDLRFVALPLEDDKKAEEKKP